MRRSETGSLIAAAGAALLLVSLFLSWFEPGISAWDAFEVWDLVLAGLALGVLASVAGEIGWWRGPAPAVELAVLGGCALLIVAAALVNHPPAASDRSIDGGAWMALVGAVLIVAGGLMDRVGVSLAVDPRARRTRPAAPTPRARPAPAGRDVPTASPAPAPPPVARSRPPARGLFARGRSEDETTEQPPPRRTDAGP